jgi:hypothetical protein
MQELGHASALPSSQQPTRTPTIIRVIAATRVGRRHCVPGRPWDAGSLSRAGAYAAEAPVCWRMASGGRVGRGKGRKACRASGSPFSRRWGHLRNIISGPVTHTSESLSMAPVTTPRATAAKPIDVQSWIGLDVTSPIDILLPRPVRSCITPLAHSTRARHVDGGQVAPLDEPSLAMSSLSGHHCITRGRSRRHRMWPAGIFTSDATPGLLGFNGRDGDSGFVAIASVLHPMGAALDQIHGIPPGPASLGISHLVKWLLKHDCLFPRQHVPRWARRLLCPREYDAKQQLA